MTTPLQQIRDELHASAELLNRFYLNDEHLDLIVAASDMMINAVKAGNKIISCGNGGSHCDAMHFAEELSGKFREDRQPIAALAISDPAHISCVANDFGFEQAFSRFVEALGNKGDVLLAISTSGNSSNVVQAARTAKSKGMPVVALTGNDGGQLKSHADIEIRIPHQGYADRIQEMHIKVIHCLILLIEQDLNNQKQ